MELTFNEIAPYVIISTFIIFIIFICKIEKKNLTRIDGVFAILGSFVGLIISLLNIIYSNSYLITLGPILTVACLLYLHKRDDFSNNCVIPRKEWSRARIKTINLLYWICAFIAIISYYTSPLYTRSTVFFLSISIGVAILGLEIFSNSTPKYYIILKIIFLSLLLRSSAYFISPYPVGSDPWVHTEYVRCFLEYAHITVPNSLSNYYCNYPLSHLYSTVISLLCDVDLKNSMFGISIVLIFSTIFIFLLVQKIYGNVVLGAISVLLLNFAEFHIEWSIEVIAMSFGLAIYSILLYILFITEYTKKVIYKFLLILMIFILTWTHTIATFIALISFISLRLGQIIYDRIYCGINCDISKNNLGYPLIALFSITVIYHWMDPNYPFLDSITVGFINSLTHEAKFLFRSDQLNSSDIWAALQNILGFLVYIFFGIIGSLFFLNKANQSKNRFSLFIMILVLCVWFFAFPLMGVRNIMPYRWPAFIYFILVIFTGMGMFLLTRIVKRQALRNLFIFLILFISAFSMITSSFSNMDSPFFGKEIYQRMIWTQSEIALFQKMNTTYDGMINADSQTSEVIYGWYIRRANIAPYFITSNNDIKVEYLFNNLTIWRKISLSRPVQARSTGYKNPYMQLGPSFKLLLDGKFSNIFDTGEARAYV